MPLSPQFPLSLPSAVTRFVAPVASAPQRTPSPLTAALATIAAGAVLLTVYTSQAHPTTAAPGLFATLALIYAAVAVVSHRADRFMRECEHRAFVVARLRRLTQGSR